MFFCTILNFVIDIGRKPVLFWSCFSFFFFFLHVTASIGRGYFVLDRWDGLLRPIPSFPLAAVVVVDVVVRSKS